MPASRPAGPFRRTEISETCIHEFAVVEKGARLGQGVRVGPFCHVGPNVIIGDGTELKNGVTVTGHTEIGRENVVHPYAVIGAAPQDLKYEGGDTKVRIGDRNVIREYVTINAGTESGGGVTSVGDENLLMAVCHVAHDCEVGNGCIISNAVLLAGHIVVGDHAVLSGAVALHHFVTVGEYAFIGGMSRVVRDVPPFLISEGGPAEARAVNVVGLSRHGFSKDAIAELQSAFKALFRNDEPMSAVLDRTSGQASSPEVTRLREFLTARIKGKHGRSRQP